jgi:hypothetical protein
MTGPVVRRSTVAAAFAAAGLLVVLGACGSSSSPAAAPTSSSAASGPPTSGAAPAQEVSPAGDIPDNQVFVAFTPPAGGYSLKVPEGWARTEAAGITTFTDKFNSIRLEAVPLPVAPTVASAQQNEVPAIRAGVAHYQAGKVSTVRRSSGPAVLITYGADGAPNAVTSKVVALDVERYEFWKAGTEVVVTLSAPHGADNVDPWRIVTDSFAWK